MAASKSEWIFAAGFATGLGLGIMLCLKNVFGVRPTAPPLTPFPPPPGLLGFYVPESPWAIVPRPPTRSGFVRGWMK